MRIRTKADNLQAVDPGAVEQNDFIHDMIHQRGCEKFVNAPTRE